MLSKKSLEDLKKIWREQFDESTPVYPWLRVDFHFSTRYVMMQIQLNKFIKSMARALAL
mgnify:CR=1